MVVSELRPQFEAAVKVLAQARVVRKIRFRRPCPKVLNTLKRTRVYVVRLKRRPFEAQKQLTLFDLDLLQRMLRPFGVKYLLEVIQL